jgi:hypothetical protein
MTDPQFQKAAGRHVEIVPGGDGQSHYVRIDGVEISRHDDLAKAEGVRFMIVQGWANYYDQCAARLERKWPLKLFDD